MLEPLLDGGLDDVRREGVDLREVADHALLAAAKQLHEPKEVGRGRRVQLLLHERTTAGGAVCVDSRELGLHLKDTWQTYQYSTIVGS